MMSPKLSVYHGGHCTHGQCFARRTFTHEHAMIQPENMCGFRGGTENGGCFPLLNNTARKYNKNGRCHYVNN